MDTRWVKKEPPPAPKSTSTTLTPDLQIRLQKYAKKFRLSNAEAIRQLIDIGLRVRNH